MRKGIIAKQVVVLLAAACSTSLARANLISDSSFENGVNPLPGLGSVVGPPFSPGFWGAEKGGEVLNERGVQPWDLTHMLYMEDEGGNVTQAFQAVDVSAFTTLIDSGNAQADFRAVANTYLSGQEFAPGLMFFATANSWPSPIGSQFWGLLLDSDANTWENFAALAPIPVGTRWIIVQVGYNNAYLPAGERAYVDSVYFNVVPEPATLLALGAGLASMAIHLRRKR